MAINHYRRKPEVVEAIQFQGEITEDLKSFLQCSWRMEKDFLNLGYNSANALYVYSGDWIIKNDEGEINVFAAEYFAERYDSISLPPFTPPVTNGISIE